MRRLLPLLLIAAATPALAAGPDAETGASEPEARASSERPFFSRVQRIERASRSQRAERAVVEPEVERPSRSERREEPRASVATEGGEAAPRRERSRRWQAPATEEIGTASDGVRERRWRDRNAERIRRAGNLPSPAPSPVVGEVLPSSRTVAPSVLASPADRRDRRTAESLRNRIATEGWRREWREDRRFDWRRHRDRHWNRYNVGIYIDPFGWNYRRWNVGWRLPSRHFGRTYWIDDPWYYRLPPAYGPYRWVRYWDDALLVDLRTGRVVDVIHNFFW